MPVETPSIFSKIIEEHLELKRRNAELEGDLPLSRYVNDDPFQNHPLFKTEEQARLEETMDGTEPAVTELADAVEPEEALQAWTEAAAVPAPEPVHASEPVSAPGPVQAPDPLQAPVAVQEDDGMWGRSRDFDWGD